MHIKRFEADDMQQALEQVRASLGEDALILSSRTVRRARGAFGLMSKNRVEVQAAVERPADRALAGADRPSFAESDGRGSDSGPRDTDVTGDTTRISSELEQSVRLLRREVARLRQREDFEEEIRSELLGLRRALGGVLARRPSTGEVEPELERLTRAGLDWVHAESLVRECRAREEQGEATTVEALLRERLEARISPPRCDRGGQLRILVGAPGVGKTTSLAKLAARNEEGERDVSLVSLDQYRIGATGQLKSFAALLGAPFCELDDLASLPAWVERQRGASVLVDTAGRGASDDFSIGSVAPLRKAFGSGFAVDLVIDATARREVQQAQLRRFRELEPDRLLIAKTDECDSLADLANLLLEDGCPPVGWLGTGQRVPEDLSMPDAARLSRTLLGRAA